MNKTLSKAINSIKWAYFLIYVHFTIGGIDLLADWWAYMIIFGALPVIRKYEPSALLLQTMTFIMIFAELAEQFFTVFRISVPYAFSVIVGVMYTYIHFQLITNIHTAVTSMGCSGGWLIPLRNIILIAHTVHFLFLHLSDSIMAVMLFGIIDLIGCICLIFSLGSQEKEMKAVEQNSEIVQSL